MRLVHFADTHIGIETHGSLDTNATEQGEFLFNVRRAMAVGADLDDAAEFADAEMNGSELCPHCGTRMCLSYSRGKWGCPKCGDWKAL